ncbi:Arginase/deacetylase [Trametes sanguinea]|nr:Arginase/deacetylase [Trametes sanguinea]
MLHYVRAVHSDGYVAHIQTIYDDWVADGGDKDGTKLSPIARAETFRAASAAVQVTLSAARALADSRLSPVSHGVFALVRPPGHHAQSALSGGYCFFNNVAIAAKYLLGHHNFRGIAILDVDYHHGNGTQEIFYEDPRVLYVSLHADGDYPYFTGGADERGAAAGLGYNYNFPIPRKDGTDEVYCETLQQAVDVIKKHEEVEFVIIVSLRVDTYQDDPICDFLLTQDCYPRIGGIIASLNKPTLFVMEGGYHLETLGDNVASVLLGFEQAMGSA